MNKKNSLSHVALLFICNFLTFYPLDAHPDFSTTHVEVSLNRHIMDHRFGLHALAINLKMDGGPISRENQITNEIKDFLTYYPNQEDYWEIVNKNLILFLSKLYPQQQQIQSTLSIEPDFAKPFNRKSICKINNGEMERQAFAFSILNQAFRNNLVNITVEMEYHPNALPNDYVNFFAVKEAVEVFLKDNALSDHSNSLLPAKIAEHLLGCFTSVRGFSIVLEIPPHSCNFNGSSWNATLLREENISKEKF